ncbi:fatty acid desaturase [Streptomyces sp. NPDC040750]|uniref:fatty acid desaturase family protein n=1 Tax=Streptomyces sp. NPDC040750 TaxID=3154491 RepID=UPI00340C9106
MSESRQTTVLEENQAARLDSAEDPIFAPVKGTDIRRNLPRHMYLKRPSRFTIKFFFAMALNVVCWAVLAEFDGFLPAAIAIILLGLSYAHLVELQHECLHEHAYRSRKLNRFFGVICGLFMLNSYWHYKHDHLRHHAFLGTPQNQEFFNYRFKRLHSWYGIGFIIATMHPGRYGVVARDMARSLTGRAPDGVERPLDARKVRSEYWLLVCTVAAGITFTVVTGSLFLLWAWILPAVLVAEPAHFLIEMPEHFGLNTQSDPNVLANTRTIKSSRVGQWYTNYNNLHTAHHFHQGVPMAQAEALHALIAGRVEATEKSYWSFYWKVIRGRIRYQNLDETCMTR